MKKRNKNIVPFRLLVDLVVFTIEDGDLKVLLQMETAAAWRGYLTLPEAALPPEKTSEWTARAMLGRFLPKNSKLGNFSFFETGPRDPRGRTISLVLVAIAPRSVFRLEGMPAVERPILASVRKLSRIALNHEEIIRAAAGWLKNDAHRSDIIAAFLGKYFTLYEAQAVAAVLTGRELDKRNFRKKFLASKAVKKTGKTLRGRRQRPARLYRFL
jgi:8-oxo-dGTP diphosphatase